MFKIFIYLIAFCFSMSIQADEIERVYRAAMDTPENVKAGGGFYPRGMDGTRPNQPPANINLWDHTNGVATGMSRHDSGYMSTSSSRGAALDFMATFLRNEGYIYHIRPTPNFIDVNRTLGRYSPHPFELEYAALGVIHWNQIIGWERVSRGGVIGDFVRNPDYRETLYSNLFSAGAQPQLAGFPPGHAAWQYEPWAPFARCDFSAKRELEHSCYPVETAQQAGINWFWKSYRKINAMLLIGILD